MMFKKSITLLLLVFQIALAKKATANQMLTTHSICRGDLKAEIETIINQPSFKRSRWGILIQTLATQETLYSLDSQRYFIPASLVKLLTTAAAVSQLGKDFQIRTSFYGSGTVPSLTSLRVVGRGDPSLNSDRLTEVAKQLKSQGVREIQELILEDSYFKDVSINPTWEWFDIYNYWAVAVNSLILNQNTFTVTIIPQKIGQPVKLEWSDPVAARQWRVNNQAITTSADTDSSINIEGVLGQPILTIKGNLPIDAKPDIWNLAIAEPAYYFLETFRDILLTEGITVNTATISYQSQSLPKDEKELAVITSPNLEVLLKEINQKSNNLYAEAIAKILATELKERDIIKNTLTQLGVNPEDYILTDASGLSRHNLATPEVIVKTLQIMAQSKQADIYRKSLAVENNSLVRRFANTPVAGNLQAKTGTLTGVSGLSGYLNVPNYETLVFTIIINQSEQSIATQRKAIDEIILLLSRLKDCN